MRSEAPLTRETVLSLNRKRVQGAYDRQKIAELNLPPNPGRTGTQNARPSAPPPAAPKRALPSFVHPLRKGQKVPLENGGRLQKLRVCVGWNVSDPACEADVSAFLLQNGRVPGDGWFVFYGQEESPDGSTVFGAAPAPDREQIALDFTRLNPAVDRIAFILTINEALEKGLNFSRISDVYLRVLDAASGEELASFQIEESYANVVSMTIGEIYLHNGAWKFSAVGNGVETDLAGLCRRYGVRIE